MNAKQLMVNSIKRKLGHLFNDCCEICHVNFSKKGMTFHHLNYIETEKKHSDFGKKGYDSMLKYYQYLEPIITNAPERFSYLCNPHHHVITLLLRFSVEKQERIFDLVRRSRE